jgi:transposase
MRWHGRRVAVYAYAVPTDMRKGFDGLCALVAQGLHRNPLSGDVFLFVSRDRIRAKVLQWDGTGLCVYAKRLENADAPITLTISELELFLDGSTLVGRMVLSPPAITEFSLAGDHFSLASDHE